MVEHRSLKIHREDAVLRVTLANPAQRNAQTPSLWKALGEVARTLDPDIRVVIIDAEGNDFSAGLHLDMFRADGMEGEVNLMQKAKASETEFAELIAEYQHGFTAWRETDAIVVAAVQGHAIGAGFQLALGADLRVVSDDVHFAMREVSLGMIPDLGGTAPLTQTVGYSRALEICLTGRFVEAQEAVGSGLASLAVPRQDLAATTDQVVAALLEAPAPAVREMKKLALAATLTPVSEQVTNEAAAQARLLHRIAAGSSKG